MTTLNLSNDKNENISQTNLWKGIQEAFDMYSNDPTMLTRQLCREVTKYKGEDGIKLMSDIFYTALFRFATRGNFEMHQNITADGTQLTSTNEFVTNVNLQSGFANIVVALNLDDTSTMIAVITLADTNNSTAILQLRHANEGETNIMYFEAPKLN